MSCRRRVFYEGRVQGVGFRWTSQSIASRFMVSGWVRNLLDGRVEMVVEGDEDEVNSYLEGVSSHFGRMIHSSNVIPETAKGLSGAFEIRR